MSTPVAAPLASVRIIESAILGTGALTAFLRDLGAEIIKVESPDGDYIRQMTWPIIEGESLLHLHISRGKRSITLDLRTEEGVNTYLDLVRGADAVIEGMRPGSLERRGLGFARLAEANPKIVYCTISGYGATGPLRDMPSHGIAFDTWAGLVQPAVDDEGFTYIPEHPSMGMHVGPMFGALAVLSGIIQARTTGVGLQFEVAQSDAAAAMDWYRSETWRAYERPESEVTGNASDNYERRPAGTAGMREAVRYQIYATGDGHVLFQASEGEFWENFCHALGRGDLLERFPTKRYADHARGNRELQRELRDIFGGRTSAEWIEFGAKANTPIAAVNTPKTIVDDPQFRDRFQFYSVEQLGAEQLPSPIKVVGAALPTPTRAPKVGQHTDEIAREILGYDDVTMAAKRAAGAFGPAST